MIQLFEGYDVYILSVPSPVLYGLPVPSPLPLSLIFGYKLGTVFIVLDNLMISSKGAQTDGVAGLNIVLFGMEPAGLEHLVSAHLLGHLELVGSVGDEEEGDIDQHQHSYGGHCHPYVHWTQIHRQQHPPQDAQVNRCVHHHHRVVVHPYVLLSWHVLVDREDERRVEYRAFVKCSQVVVDDGQGITQEHQTDEQIGYGEPYKLIEILDEQGHNYGDKADEDNNKEGDNLVYFREEEVILDINLLNKYDVDNRGLEDPGSDPIDHGILESEPISKGKEQEQGSPQHAERIYLYLPFSVGEPIDSHIQGDDEG